MNTAQALLRDDLRDFVGYSSARSAATVGDVWLNANESACTNAGDPQGTMRRYPDPQPEALRSALASLYAVTPTQLLVGRGSDECIDLLVRTFCVPGRSHIVIAPPVFGMYAVCARLQGTRVIEVPLVDGDDGLRADLDAVGDAALANSASLVFLCSPGNPSGEALPATAIARLADRLSGHSLVVVDEAYAEYSSQASAIALLGLHDNLVVLRTLSKAHALAAARIGCAIAEPGLVAALRRSQAPYPIARPCTESALAALAPEALARTQAHVASTCAERDRLSQALRLLSGVIRAYPSDGNFLLVRFTDADAAFTGLLAAGIVVRDMRAMPQLGDALRISVGTQQDNDRVLMALDAVNMEAA